MTFKPLTALLALALLSGCVAPTATTASHGHATLSLVPAVRQGLLRVQDTVKPYEQSDIKVLRVTLSKLDGDIERPILGADQVPLQKDVPGDRLAEPIVFANLAFETTYRIRTYAYADPAKTDLISETDAGSHLDLRVERDDRHTLIPLPVQLKNKVFSGVASTSNVVVSPGGFDHQGVETIAF